MKILLFKFYLTLVSLIIIGVPTVSIADGLPGNWTADGAFIPIPNFAAVITADGSNFNVSPSATIFSTDAGCSFFQGTTYLILTPKGGNLYGLQKFAPVSFLGCTVFPIPPNEDLTLSIAPDTNSFVACRVTNPNDCATFTRQGVPVTPPPSNITGLTKNTVPAQPTVKVKGKTATLTCQKGTDATGYEGKIQKRKKPAVTKTSKTNKVVFSNLAAGEYSASCRISFKIGKKAATTKYSQVTGFQIK